MMLKLSKMKLSPIITTTRIFSGELPRIFTGEFPRHLSTTAVATSGNTAPKEKIEKKFLSQKLYKLGFTDGDVSEVLHRTMRSGKLITKDILLGCLKDLRKFKRYDHCLQILDWMEKGRYDYSSTEFALRLDILCKQKGIAEAEKYFDDIPSDMKNQSVYGALLNSYCKELDTDKALAIFQKMDEMGFASHVLAFNNLLFLYVNVGQPEKVLEYIAEMKNRKIPLNVHAYSFWIQGHRLLGDLEGVERVFEEAQQNVSIKNNWFIHSNVASAFIASNQLEKATSYLEKMENILNYSDYSDRHAYHHLFSLYGSAGNLEAVIRVWNTIKPKLKADNRLTYLALLQALSKLDDITGMEKYLEEWESSSRNYDDRLPATLIGAYLKHDMLEKAEVLLEDGLKKAGKRLRMPHVRFMNYYFEKRKTDLALKHMEIAVDSKWKPVAEKLGLLFEYFKVEKDVDGAETFCRVLKKAQALDSKGYRWLLQIYVDAEKAAIDMRKRLKNDGISITPELEELLQQVCPN